MLACARIGAIHSVVFGGFSPDSLADRINDCDSKLVITTDGGKRGGRNIPLKGNTDEALKSCADDVQVLMFRYAGTDVAFDRAARPRRLCADAPRLRPTARPSR